MKAAIQKLNHKPWTWALLLAAAMAFHFAAEAWWKALLIMIGAILLDIVVDVVFFRAEQAAGEVGS